tara:strand:- start:563 stop:1873 length:1311 start_codon:yes stop_codon:yes gene_type:complete
MPATISSTSSLATMLPEYARRIGAYVGSFTTTTPVTTNTSVVCTTLGDRGWDVDDILNDFYLKVTSGENDGAIRRISDYTGSSGTITVSGSNLAAESGNVTFEIYRYDPQRLTDTLQDAGQEIFPKVFVPVYDRTNTASQNQYDFTRPPTIPRGYVRQLFAERKLYSKTYAHNIVNDQNCDLEADTITNWTSSNVTAAVEEDTTNPDNAVVWADRRSAKVTVDASSTGQFYLTVTSPTNYEGEEINFAVWVYSRTASRISPFIQIDSDAASTGDAHTGKGWERLTVSTDANLIGTSIKVGIQISSGTQFTCYVDEAIATAGQEELPRYGRVAIRNWYEQGDNIYVLERVPENHNVLVVGMGMLDFTNLSSTAQEVNENSRRMLYNQAAMLLFQGEIDTVDSTEQQEALNRFNHFRNRSNENIGSMAPIAMLRNTAS